MSFSIFEASSSAELSRAEIARLGFNPQTQPVVESAYFPAIAPQYLQLSYIKEAVEQPIYWEVESLFKNEFFSNFSQQPQAIASAVCMPLVQRDEGLTILFTRRAKHLPSHPGQVCFPGGRIDLSDNNAIHTALRETFEEVGIAPGHIQPLAQHPILLTSTQYAMQPIIAMVKEGFTINPDPSEVAQVFEVPLSVLMNPANHRLHHIDIPATKNQAGQSRYYFSIRWQEYFIWGATAAVIRNFYHYLSAAAVQFPLTKT